MILCGANSYEQKFYFDSACASLPQQVKDELKILCVTFVEDVVGILTVELDDASGDVRLSVRADEADYLFDEVGSELKIKQMQVQRRELFEALRAYYRVFFLHMSPEEAAAQDED